MKRFLEVLSKVEQQLKLDLTQEDIADILWLARYQKPQQRQQKPQQNLAENQPTSSPQPQHEKATSSPGKQTTQSASLYTYNPTSSPKVSPVESGSILVKAPSPPALREPLKLAKALRPLMRRIPSSTEMVLDEIATAQRIAEEKICVPVLKPSLEHWLDLALVVDESPSMAIWRQTLIALQQLLERHGAFRDVRTWGMIINDKKDDKKQVLLRCGIGALYSRSRPTHNPRELLHPSGRRLILIISDCVSPAWRDGLVTQVLSDWVRTAPLAIVQMLPEWLWERSALGLAAPVKLRSLTPGAPNQKLIVEDLASWDDIDVESGIKVPVINLEPEPFATWAQMVVGAGDTQAVGFVFESSPTNNQENTSALDEPVATSLSPEERVYRFLNTASPMARKLAGLLASAPVISLPVVQMLQKQMKMLEHSRQVHTAEVFLGGLLKRLPSSDADTHLDNPDYFQYDFLDDKMRDILLDAVPISNSIEVLNAVSDFVEEHAGLSIKSFMAQLLDPTSPNNQPIDNTVLPFARVTAQVLKRLGGEAAQIAQRLEQQIQKPDLQEVKLQPFEFDVVTLNATGQIINRERHTAQFFTENLPDGVTLEMVYILGGTFEMGSPKDEAERYENESTQHKVTVPRFFMGKYPVTQKQWHAVASLDQVNRELDPNPSEFKGDDLPVENISWYDCVEFCARLSAYTKRDYRLPSEAEWEYACRADTTTPFHFGETISTEVANYDGNYTYGSGSQGEYREKTTPVGSFQVANAFGLFDMHGNVWEWCADKYHENYLGAPVDGSAWIEDWIEETNENDNQAKVLRGGSWIGIPGDCRSACRDDDSPVSRLDGRGFRVVVSG